jgi:hypothetical protein
LAILIDDTAKAEAVVARQMALATTVEARGQVLVDAMDELLGLTSSPLVRHPVRLAAANAILARLDALGPEARIPQFLGHQKMRQIAEVARFDTTALLRQDRALRAIVARFTPEERKVYGSDIMTLMFDSIMVAWFQRPPERPAVVRGIVDRHFAAFGPGELTPQQVEFIKSWPGVLASQVGKPAPPITGTFWFPPGRPHVQPTPGKVTLVMEVEKEGGLMSPRMAMLRRIYDRYHDRGLEIVLVLKTQGFSWSSPPQTPADEARAVAWYYYDYLKLPFTVVVDETPFTTQPDGRRVAGKIAFEQQYVLPSVLIGRDGRIFTLWLGFISESQRNSFVAQALAAPTA